MKKKVILSGIIGNVIEWYDFALFGFMSSYLSQLFFPHSHSTVSSILLILMFGLCFFMRPVGALIYGYYGDTLGRRFGLLTSILLISIPTCLMGLIPTYAQWGYLATTLLLITRLLQSLSAGGEFGGSVVFCLEHAPIRQKGFYASLPMTAAMTGVTLGALLPTFINFFFSHQQIINWAWRIPFLFSLLLGLPGYFLRRSMIETPVFKQLKQHHELVENPIMSSLKTHFREIIKVAFIVAFGGVINYLIIIFIPSYLSQHQTLSVVQASLFSCLSLLVVVCFIVISGKLSDRYNKKLLLLSIIFLTFILVWHLCQQLLTNNVHHIIFTLLFFSVIEGCYFGIMMAYLGDLFPAQIRYTSLSFGYNLGFALFAGLAPICANLLMLSISPELAVAYLVFLSALISMVGVLIS
jgi:MHS family proline/betaine transporter-like MFS transporter